MSALLANAMTEDELLEAVIDCAHTFKWLVHHSRPAMTQNGWRTAITGDKGLPDLIMARSGRLVIAELKRESGTPTPEQTAWLTAMHGTPELSSVHDSATVHVFIFKPSDWLDGTILEVLR